MAISVPRPTSVAVGGVRSETGPLLRVMVHRPGRELDRLTPGNAADLLFDDVIWPDLAREEHDILVATLAGAGAEVLYFGDLLAGALRAEPARGRAIEGACAAGPESVRTPVGEWLSQLDAPHLAGVLIGGATFEEAGIEPPRIAGPGSPRAASGFAVAPLPNQMFVRDTSAWLGTELVLGARSNPVRSGETRAVEQVYEHHPMFGRIPRRRGPIDADGIEGGDLMCLGDRAILVGIGSRTSREGVEGLAAQLFERGFERVLTVEIPPERSSIHLDCLMTLVDADAMLVDRRLLDSPVVEMLPAAGPVSSRIWPSLPAALAAALEIDAMRVVEVADEREQWTLGANTLAVAPGRVIAFSRNVRTNDALAAAGIEVLPVPGEELSRGRGGPRCLTCPLTRAPVVAS